MGDSHIWCSDVVGFGTRLMCKQYRWSTGLEWCKYQYLSPSHVVDCQQMNITFSKIIIYDISTWPVLDDFTTYIAHPAFGHCTLRSVCWRFIIPNCNNMFGPASADTKPLGLSWSRAEAISCGCSIMEFKAPKFFLVFCQHTNGMNWNFTYV